MGANILGFATPAADDSGSSTSAATGDPVASISGLDLTVDGAAAAAGNLVVEFSAGSAVTVALDGTEDTAGIATKIADAVNDGAAAGAGTATATGSVVAFDFTSATSPYDTATSITIGAATNVSQSEIRW